MSTSREPSCSSRRRAVLWLPVVWLLLITTASGASPGSQNLGRGSASADAGATPAGPTFSQETVLVRFRPGLGQPHRADVLRDAGASQHATVRGTGYTLVGTNGEEPTEVAAQLDRDSRVANVELNYLRRAAAEPDDPYYSKGVQPYLRTLRLPQAWGISQGGSKGAIAILDSGVDLDHPELDSRVLPGWDFVNGDQVAHDDNGHGTLVAGIAAAETDNGAAASGAAWEARILPVKVLDASGAGNDADIAAGLTWAADNGATIINLSFSGPGESDVLRRAVDYALARDVVVIAAAGNTGGSQPQYPAAHPGVIAVSATDWAGNALAFSAHGPWVDLAAPGLELVSTKLAPSTAAWHEFGVRDPVTGTSFSAALVAGIAHLVRSAHPFWSAARVSDRLKLGARDLGPPGIDDTYGAGLADAYGALGGPPPPNVAPPRGDWRPNDVPERASRPTYSPEYGTFRTGPHETIAPHGDADWYAFEVPKAGDVSVGLTPSPVELTTGGTDYRLEVFDSDLRLLARTDNGGVEDSEGTIATLERPGLLFAKVTAVTGSTTNGEYELVVRPLNEPYDNRIRGFLFPEWHPQGMERPRSVAIADVTGDGRSDVLATDAPDLESAALVVYPQISDGWLGDPIRMPLGSRAVGGHNLALATGDLDGDGLTDIAAATEEGVKVYRQHGGALAHPVLIPGTTGADQLEIADLNGDGRPDLVVRGTGVRVFLNGQMGWIPSPVTDDYSSEIETGDVTGDGRLDIVATVWLSAHNWQVHVFVQAPNGEFSRRATPPITMSLDAVAVGDVTGDGRNDVIAADGFHDKLFVFPQTAAGGLGNARSYLVRGVDAVETADVNGDGRIDVVTGGFWAGVLPQQADGTLAPLQWWGFGHTVQPKGLVIGDVTGDGAPDLTFADENYGVAVHRRLTSSWPLPEWVRDTTPADFAVGTSVSEQPQIRLARDLDRTSITAQTVRLLDGRSGANVAAEVAYDSSTRTLVSRPEQPLAPDHPYAVRLANLTDTSGNRMLVPYTYRFRVGAAPVDSTPPDTQFRDPFVGNRVHSGRADWYATEPGARFECAYDDDPSWERCGELWNSTLWPGTYDFTIRVRAIDGAGNVDQTPAVRTWIVDSTRNPPSNDTKETAERISGSSGRASGTNVRAGYSVCAIGGIDSNDVFYRWIAPTSGDFTFDTNGSSFDTILGVYDPAGERCPEAIADDDSGEGLQSEVTFQADAGSEYVVVIAGFRTDGLAAAGDIVLNWRTGYSPLTNTVAPSISGTTRVGELLTAEPGEWTGDAAEYRYQWRRCEVDGTHCRNVAGATGRTHSLTPDDAGLALQIVVTAVRQGRRESARSTPTAGVLGAPTVITGDPVRITPTSALVAVRVRSNGVATIIHVAFGTTNEYGHAAVPLEVGASFAWHELEFELGGLTPGVDYHYRAVARNAEGEHLGDDEIFATPSEPSAQPPPNPPPPPLLAPVPAPPATDPPVQQTSPTGPGRSAPTTSTALPSRDAETPSTASRRLRVALRLRRLVVSNRGLTTVRLRCPFAAHRQCRGTVRLVARGQRAVRPRRVVAMRPGAVSVVRLRLSRSWMRVVDRHRRARARLYFTGRDTAGRSLTVSFPVSLSRRK